MSELARLPELTAEELDVLADALEDLALKLVGDSHTAPGHFAVLAQWRGQTVMSLLTAVREARLSLERTGDTG